MFTIQSNSPIPDIMLVMKCAELGATPFIYMCVCVAWLLLVLNLNLSKPETNLSPFNNHGGQWLMLFPLFLPPPNMDWTTFRGESALSTDVSFYCRPYLLQISLPGALCTDDDEDGPQMIEGGTGSRSRAIYDTDLDFGTLFVTLRKCNKGEWLPDLELISNLLQPVHHHLPQRSGGAGIEVISSSTATDADASSTKVEVVESSRSAESAGCKMADVEEELAQGFERVVGFGNSHKPVPVYGFNGRHSCVFRDLRDELSDIVELPLPDETPVELRTALREEQEARDFDPERYIGDLLYGDEDYILMEALAGQMPLFIADLSTRGGEYFSDEERQQLASLRPSLVMGVRGLRLQTGSADERAAMNGLADMLCGFAYDWRTTGGERNVESSWTCTILSSTLSWLEPWGLLCSGCEAETITDPSRIDGPKAVIRSFFRRVLCYPYLRRWDLAMLCTKDSSNTIQGGKRAILRALLYLHSAIEHSESKYLLNKLYVVDYIFWIQSSDLTDECLITYAKQMKDAINGLTKADVALYIDEYEAMADKSHHIEKEKLATRKSREDSNSSSRSINGVSSSLCGDGIREEEFFFLSPAEEEEYACSRTTSSDEGEKDDAFCDGGGESASPLFPSRPLITELQ